VSDKPFPCKQCSRGFDTEQALKVHVTRIHKKKAPQRITIRIVPGRKRKKKKDK
jgi:hypothetical protein